MIDFIRRSDARMPVLPRIALGNLKRIYESTDDVVVKCAALAASWNCVMEESVETIAWLEAVLLDDNEHRLPREQAIRVLTAVGNRFGGIEDLASFALRQYVERNPEAALAAPRRNELSRSFGSIIEEEDTER